MLKAILRLEEELTEFKKRKPPVSDKDWFGDYSKRPTQKDFDKAKKDADSWKTAYELERDKVKQLETDKLKLTTDLTNKNAEIYGLLAKWKAKDLTDLSAGIQNTLNKRKEAEANNKVKDDNIKALELDNKDLKTKFLRQVKEVTEHWGTIIQKNKDIKNLELKNENLTSNYKKLIQFLADARQLVSHLQKDLQTEKQDKAHIQQELNDALTILNKPTAEMGSQTDLTAEQITQMKKDLETKNNELAKLRDRKGQSEEYEKKLQELNQLQTKLDVETKTKEELSSILNTYRHNGIIINCVYSLVYPNLQKLFDDRNKYRGNEGIVVFVLPEAGRPDFYDFHSSRDKSKILNLNPDGNGAFVIFSGAEPNQKGFSIPFGINIDIRGVKVADIYSVKRFTPNNLLCQISFPKLSFPSYGIEGDTESMWNYYFPFDKSLENSILTINKNIKIVE